MLCSFWLIVTIVAYLFISMSGRKVFKNKSFEKKFEYISYINSTINAVMSVVCYFLIANYTCPDGKALYNNRECM